MVLAFVSGCTSNVYKTYDNNGISFNYPYGWSELSPDQLSLTVEGNSEVLAAVADPNNVQNDNYQILAFFQHISTTSTLADAISAIKAEIQAAGGQIISEKDRTINGVPANDLVYTISTQSGVAKKERFIALQDNNNLYYIVCSAPTADFDGQQSNFDLIIDSFEIQ
ncbi:PsbP-related protein [Methanobacterium sp.]|uniref:PsbP-related protein n=1 Tax=Methanobacterium sp. TaxID=2164 RepID=UPI0025E2B6FB|nr:PsbP-related protein [Methanobacterium sp.]MBI5458881.1 hypothetical protein [Methanobacterium sp.]MDY9924448.1 PsbP-related protein [Methanobacterium sp.]